MDLEEAVLKDNGQAPSMIHATYSYIKLAYAIAWHQPVSFTLYQRRSCREDMHAGSLPCIEYHSILRQMAQEDRLLRSWIDKR